MRGPTFDGTANSPCASSFVTTPPPRFIVTVYVWRKPSPSEPAPSRLVIGGSATYGRNSPSCFETPRNSFWNRNSNCTSSATPSAFESTLNV